MNNDSLKKAICEKRLDDKAGYNGSPLLLCICACSPFFQAIALVLGIFVKKQICNERGIATRGAAKGNPNGFFSLVRVTIFVVWERIRRREVVPSAESTRGQGAELLTF